MCCQTKFGDNWINVSVKYLILITFFVFLPPEGQTPYRFRHKMVQRRGFAQRNTFCSKSHNFFNVLIPDTKNCQNLAISGPDSEDFCLILPLTLAVLRANTITASHQCHNEASMLGEESTYVHRFCTGGTRYVI